MEMVEGLKTCWENQKRAVVATIVLVEGSTYRREGAGCLILEDGSVIGTVSAGCVEGDLYEHAMDVLETGKARLQPYDFRQEGDVPWGLGLGCNGAMQILLQPFDPVHDPVFAKKVFRMMETKVSCRKECMVGIIIESADPVKQAIGTPYIFEQEDQERLRFWRDANGFAHMEMDGVLVTMYLETVKPQPVLVVCGAGPDAVPLVQGAKAIGWHVTLMDHREQSLNRQAFSSADERLLIGRGDYAHPAIPEEAHVVVMTHNYVLDAMLVKALLPTQIPYLGVLGPRRRMERILKEIGEENGRPRPDEWKKLHAPIGLDIGADSPQEIALSILAELTSFRNQRNGQSLKMRKEPLHERNRLATVQAEG